MSQIDMDQSCELGLRDMNFIQSFFWVTGELFEKTLTEHRRGKKPGQPAEYAVAGSD